jgi:peptide chain release factor
MKAEGREVIPDFGNGAEPWLRRFVALGLREEDIEESFVRSSGPGGQNVNKVSTCVVLLHRPSGIQVRCQESRQQASNRARAREMLADRIEAVRRETELARRAEIEKNRRRKRGRSRGAKERILANKARQSARKRDRRRPNSD